MNTFVNSEADPKDAKLQVIQGYLVSNVEMIQRRITRGGLAKDVGAKHNERLINDSIEAIKALYVSTPKTMSHPMSSEPSMCTCSHPLVAHMEDCRVHGCDCKLNSKGEMSGEESVSDEVSLCDSCNCMTHTIDDGLGKYRFGKCVARKQWPSDSGTSDKQAVQGTDHLPSTFPRSLAEQYAAHPAGSDSTNESELLSQRIQKLELLLALAGMYGQYCSGPFGHDFMGAGEDAISLLEDYKLATEKDGVDDQQVDVVEKILADYQTRYAALQAQLDEVKA